MYFCHNYIQKVGPLNLINPKVKINNIVPNKFETLFYGRYF